jgi:integrase
MGRRPDSKKRVYTVGQVGVTKHPNGHYRIRWSGAHKGERTARSLDEAKKVADSIFAELQNGGKVTLPCSTVASLVAIVTDPTGKAWEREWEQTVSYLARNFIVPELGEIKARDLTSRQVEDTYKKIQSEGYSDQTIAHVVRLMRQVGRAGVKAGIWRSGGDPISDVAKPKRVVGKIADTLEVSPDEIPTPEEVESLACAMDKINKMYGLIIRVAAGTGLRWAEICGLQKKDIDLKNRTIWIGRTRRELPGGGSRIKSPKTKAGTRHVVIPTGLVEALREHLENLNHDYVFATRNGTVISRSNWARTMNIAKRNSEFPEAMAIHSLRHYAASTWIALGLSIADVSRMLGHSNTATTARLYIHADKSSMERLKTMI